MDSAREYLQIETQDSLFFLNVPEQETHFSCENDRALPEVAQKSCGVPIPELFTLGGPV